MLGAVISLTVTNMGSGPSSGEVTVVDKVPAGLTTAHPPDLIGLF